MLCHLKMLDVFCSRFTRAAAEQGLKGLMMGYILNEIQINMLRFGF